MDGVRRRRGLVLLLVALLPVMLIAGIWLGAHPDRLPGFLRTAVAGNSDGALFEEAMDVLEESYYKPVDRGEVVGASIQGAVETLEERYGDRFSAYFSPDAYSHFQEVTTGEFEGVGMNVREVKAGLRILTVFERSPAAKAGLRRGDTIVAVDGKSIAGVSSDQATARIKGPAGSKVDLTLERRGAARRTVTVERARVDVPVVESALRKTDAGVPVAHVRLASFTSGAHGEVDAATRRLLRRGAKAVVLDLRGNGGGLLNEAVQVSSIFIPEGTVVTTRGRKRAEKVFKATGRAIDKDVPVVVLVDGASASASEIVTGALQDRERAAVVGTRTFGKGVFQEVRQLSNGGALDITVGEYFTPEGRNLGPRNGARGGIVPDVTARDRTATERDEALEAALDALAQTER
jgi:carboxyl-terminal processing protease